MKKKAKSSLNLNARRLFRSKISPNPYFGDQLSTGDPTTITVTTVSTLAPSGHK